jgi:hypothetical protein
MVEYVSVVVALKVSNMTILHPIPAGEAGEYLIFSYCVKAVIAVNPIAAIAKFIIEKLVPIAATKEALVARLILPRQAANNAAAQRNKAHGAGSELQVPLVVVITTDNSNP